MMATTKEVVVPNLDVPNRKPMALWAKVLLIVGALIGLGIGGYFVVLFWALFTLGSAGTDYNEVVTKEAERIEPSLLVAGCTKVRGGEYSHGNLDAIEKYRFEYACNPAPENLDQQVGDALLNLGYQPYAGQPGIYRNDCCEIQYQGAAKSYIIGLYSNEVDGREN